MCWYHVATRVLNRKQTENENGSVGFSFFLPKMSVGFDSFLAAMVGCFFHGNVGSVSVVFF